jgi:hypothetical protein
MQQLAVIRKMAADLNLPGKLWRWRRFGGGGLGAEFAQLLLTEEHGAAPAYRAVGGSGKVARGCGAGGNWEAALGLLVDPGD